MRNSDVESSIEVLRADYQDPRHARDPLVGLPIGERPALPEEEGLLGDRVGLLFKQPGEADAGVILQAQEAREARELPTHGADHIGQLDGDITHAVPEVIDDIGGHVVHALRKRPGVLCGLIRQRFVVLSALIFGLEELGVMPVMIRSGSGLEPHVKSRARSLFVSSASGTASSGSMTTRTVLVPAVGAV